MVALEDEVVHILTLEDEHEVVHVATLEEEHELVHVVAMGIVSESVVAMMEMSKSVYYALPIE